MDLEVAPGTEVNLPDPNNCMVLNVDIKPIESTSPWKGATYHFVVTIPHDYPYKAPKAECKTMVKRF